MNLFKLFSSKCSDDDIRSETEQSTLLISIALKQFESANSLYAESKKIESALRNLEEHTENDYTSLAGINKNAEEALFRIIMEKMSFQAELHKLTE